jgi:hypothetical protein
MDNPILKDIAIASGKTVAQVNFLTNQISLLFFNTNFPVA